MDLKLFGMSVPWDKVLEYLSWDKIYHLLGIHEYVYLTIDTASNPQLIPIKIMFIFFSLLFLGGVWFFYNNSSYIKYRFLQSSSEIRSFEPYGMRGINKQWAQIMKSAATGIMSDLRLAIIEADDLLHQTLDEAGFEGDTFEDIVESAEKKMLVDVKDILLAHSIRNSLVHDPDYKLDGEIAKKILANYERAIKNTFTT